MSKLVSDRKHNLRQAMRLEQNSFQNSTLFEDYALGSMGIYQTPTELNFFIKSLQDLFPEVITL